MRTDCGNDHKLNRITEYLLWNAEIEQARRQAAAFTANLPWLTETQCEDVQRVYIADRVAVSHAMLKRIGDRAGELRGEYSKRYMTLKMRCVAAAAGCVVAVIGASTTVVLLSH